MKKNTTGATREERLAAAQKYPGGVVSSRSNSSRLKYT